MKRLLAIVLVLVATAMAGDLTGKWSGSFKADGADHVVPQLFIFKQDGNKLTGSGGPDQNEQYPIENGKIDGSRVRFELTTGEWRFTYDLRMDGPKLAGDLELKGINDRRTAKVSLTETQ